VLPQLLHNLLGYKIQHTMYLSSCRLLSSISRPMWLNPSTIHTALQLLDATLRIVILPFLIPTDKLVLCWGQHHLLLSVCLGSLKPKFKAYKPTFFPTHLLHSYLHLSDKWRLRHRSEQACVVRLFRAPVCRLSGFGHITVLILMRLRPQILNFKRTC